MTSNSTVNGILSDEEFMTFFKKSIDDLRTKSPKQHRNTDSVLALLADCLLTNAETKLEGLTDDYKSKIHILFCYQGISDLGDDRYATLTDIKSKEDIVEYILTHIGIERLEKLNIIIHKSKLEYNFFTFFSDINSFYDFLFRSMYISYKSEGLDNLNTKIDMLIPLEERGLPGDRFFELICASHITPEYITLLGENLITYDDEQLGAILFGKWAGTPGYSKGPIDHIKLLGDDIHTLGGDQILNIYYYLSPEMMKIINTSSYRSLIYSYRGGNKGTMTKETNTSRFIFIPLDILQVYITGLEAHGDIKKFFDNIEEYIATNQKTILTDRGHY